MTIKFMDIRMIYNALTSNKLIEYGNAKQKYLTILLTNLHLLYDDRFNSKSRDTIKNQIKQDISFIDLAPIYKELEHIKLSVISNTSKPVTYNTFRSIISNISSDYINIKEQDKNQKLFLYCLIISQIYLKNDDLISDMTTKLLRYFGDVEAAMRYLEHVDYSSRNTIELSFKYELLLHSTPYLKFWQALNRYAIGKKQLPIILKSFNECRLLEQHDEFKDLINRPINKQTIETIIKIFKATIYSYNTSDLSKNIKQLVENLVTHAYEVQLNHNQFQLALEFLKEGKLKTEDNMPDISFEFLQNKTPFVFRKLPKEDIRGFILGKYTHCCQSIGDKAESCVIDGMSKANAGFYVVIDKQGKIRAQSYAWIGTGNTLVLDSFECVNAYEGATLFIKCIEGIRKVHNKKMYIGTGGGTPKIDALQITRDVEPIEQGVSAYSDSSQVYCILPEQTILKSGKYTPNECTPNECTPNVIQEHSNFKEFKDRHKLVQFNLLKKLFHDNFLELSYLIDNGFTVKMLKEMDDKDKKHFYTVFIDNKNSILHFIKNKVDIGDLNKLFYQKRCIEKFLHDKEIIILLIKNGMHINSIAKMYHEHVMKYDLITENKKNIFCLKEYINVKNLIDMYDEDCQKAKLFIEHGEQILCLLEKNYMTLEDLMRMYDEDCKKAKLFIEHGKQILCLFNNNNNMFHLEALNQLYNTYLVDNIKTLVRHTEQTINLMKLIDITKVLKYEFKKCEFFIQNSEKISLMQHIFTMSFLIGIYNKNLQLKYNYKDIIAPKSLIRMYNEDCKKAKLFIEHGEQILRLLGKNYKNITLKDLIRMYDTNSQLKYNYKDIIITPKSLTKMYDEDCQKAKLFIEYSEQVICLLEKNYKNITLEGLIRMYDEDCKKAKLFIEHGEQILYLLNDITLEDLMKMYDEDCQKAKLFIEHGKQVICLLEHNSNYKNKNITLEDLMKMYDEDCQKAKLFIEHGKQVICLLNDITLEDLMRMYDEDCQKAKLFIEYSKQVLCLLEHNSNYKNKNITLEDLMRMYDKNPQKAKLFIEYSEQVLCLLSNITLKSLMRMYDKNSQKAKLFIEYSKQVICLLNDTTLEDLMKIYDKNSQKAKLFIEYSKQVICLLNDTTLGDLMGMYDKNSQKAELFIKHGEQVICLLYKNTTPEGFTKMYDEDLQKAELFIENSKQVLCLLSGMTLEGLMKIYDKNPQKVKLFIEYGGQVLYLLEKKYMTLEDLMKMYDEDLQKAELFMKYGKQVICLLNDMTLEDLMKIYDEDLQKAKLFVVKIQNMQYLFRVGLTIQDLTNMYDQKPEKLEFFIKNSAHIKLLVYSNITNVKHLIDMYDKDIKKVKSFVHNADKIQGFHFKYKKTFSEMESFYQPNATMIEEVMAIYKIVDDSKTGELVSSYFNNAESINVPHCSSMYAEPMGAEPVIYFV